MRRIALPLAVAAVCGLSWPAQGATILNENFDELTAVLSATSVGAFSAIDGTNVDIVGAGDGFGYLCVSPESGNCVDLDGSGGNPQGVLQANTAIGPGTYDLSFDLIGSQRGNTTSTTVTFGNYSNTFTLGSGDDTDGVVVNAFVTVGPGSSLLTFTSNTAGQMGALLDNVLITTATSAVPEPSSSIPAGLALLALGLWGRRRAAYRA